MSISALLLPEFHEEMKRTRKTLEALPEGRETFKPHMKSSDLTKLGGHLAQMPLLMSVILTAPDVDLAQGGLPGLKFESKEQILAAFDGLAAQTETDLKAATDEQMDSAWKLSAGDRVIYSGPRYMALRLLGFNHMVHHRAQAGVYLRLLECPVPSIYGPSADSAA